MRADAGEGRPELTALLSGAPAVAGQALAFRQFAATATRVLVNGVPGGIAWAPNGRPVAVLAMTVRGGRIVAIEVLADPDRLRGLDLTDVAG